MKKQPPNLSEVDDETVISPIESIQHLVVERHPALLVISGPHIGRSFSVDKDEFMIGRVDNCDLTVDDDLVSRHHAKIIVNKGAAELVDLASTNGTLLNGRRVDRAPLTEGDQIQVGAVTIFKFHYQEDVERKFLGELFKAATKDFLTSTYNKKYFQDRLQSEFFYTYRHGGNLSVLVIDIDHFKKVNDTYGHLAGDIALQKVAHHLLTSTRKDDMVARFGGEEFVILMRDCDLDQARILAEHLREGIAKMVIPVDKTEIRITVSIGVATLNAQNKDLFTRADGLVEAADEQLYQAKSAGRNKVCG